MKFTIQLHFHERLTSAALAIHEHALMHLLGQIQPSITILHIYFNAPATRDFCLSDMTKDWDWKALLVLITQYSHLKEIQFKVIGDFCSRYWVHRRIKHKVEGLRDGLLEALPGTF